MSPAQKKKTYAVIAPDVRSTWTDLDTYGPMAAAQAYAHQLQLEEGTKLEVQDDEGTRRRYRVGKMPRAVHPRGRVNGPVEDLRRDLGIR